MKDFLDESVFMRVGDNDDFVMAALFTDEEKKKLKDERKKKQQELYIMKHGMSSPQRLEWFKVSETQRL
jgi:hypothetical protein